MSVQPDRRAPESPQGAGLARIDVARPPAPGDLPGVVASQATLVGSPVRREHGAAVVDWSRRHSVLLALASTLLVHLMFLSRHLGSDEGGFAMVARHWTERGGFVYGPQWVDRPPGLIAVFAAADHLGPYGVRLTAAVVAVALVAALGWTAAAVGGRPAAKWAAWAGFAFASSVLLQTQQLNGELVATTFVTVSVGALLRAVRVSRDRAQTLMLGMLAGAAAAVAVLMKQNFVDAFVFAAVLVGAGVATPTNRLTYRPGQIMGSVIGFVVGAAVPAGATLGWAQGHGGLRALLYATIGFRADASTVMATWSWDAPLQRLGVLTELAWLSGLLFLACHLAWSHRRRLRRLDPLPWAVVAATSVELFGVLAGANFWPHYLIALIPMVAVAAGLGVHQRAPGAGWTRRLVLLSAVVTAVMSPVAALSAAHTSSSPYTTGRWVAAAAHPSDTLVVPFTHANVINASGLRPGYPYAWSLPLRTLDPHLSLLTHTLDGRAAPTWVVRWDDPHAWGLDPGNLVDAALRAHYRPVAVVCGHPVWLHDGVSRRVAPTPPAHACGAGEQ